MVVMCGNAQSTVKTSLKRADGTASRLLINCLPLPLNMASDKASSLLCKHLAHLFSDLAFDRGSKGAEHETELDCQLGLLFAQGQRTVDTTALEAQHITIPCTRQIKLPRQLVSHLLRRCTGFFCCQLMLLNYIDIRHQTILLLKTGTTRPV